MVKWVQYTAMICGLALLGIPALFAKDLAAYRLNDSAAADIVTPVALDVVDPAATATLKSAQAMRTPAIFRICNDLTNALASEFLAGFAAARSNFTAAVQDNYHQPTLDNKAIASPDFGYFITAYNFKNKNFPVTTALAKAWVRGKPGLTEQKRLLDMLLLTMQHPIRPDDGPEKFSIGETLRLVPVSNSDEKLSLADAEARGKLVTDVSLTTLSQLRIIFRREFTDADEQPLARALTALLQPNCFPDPALTQLARDRAVNHLIVADHYDAGQLIVKQGAVIDAKAKRALDQMSEKLAGRIVPPTATATVVAKTDAPPIAPVEIPAQNDAPKKTILISAVVSPALSIRARYEILAGTLAAICVAASLVLWRWIYRRRAAAAPAFASDLTEQSPTMLHADLAPHLAQVVKDALVQELAVQRRELLVSQQIATSEIIGLVQRLDEMQMTMQERVQTYELQIQTLEKQLAARTEENHELLKLKIEMIREQLEVERNRNRVDFN